MTLVEFLKARLDEDEQTARAVADQSEPWPKQWTASEDGDSIRTPNDHVVVWGRGTLKPGVADHIARHDPARVLAEVEAKRRIVAWASDPKMHSELIPEAERYYVLTALALPYVAHADCREEWRP